MDEHMGLRWFDVAALTGAASFLVDPVMRPGVSRARKAQGFVWAAFCAAFVLFTN